MISKLSSFSSSIILFLESFNELNLNPDGSLKESTGGLSRDYITQFSYGIFESLNLIVPRIQGGGSREDLGENSDLYEFLIQNGVPQSQSKSFVTNWGARRIIRDHMRHI